MIASGGPAYDKGMGVPSATMGCMDIREAYRRNRATVLAAVVLLVCFAGLFMFLNDVARTSGAALVARVHDGAGNTFELPLEETAELTVETSLGRNVVVVSDATAKIVEASCPNGDCTRQAAISQPGQQLICLPNQLWVEIVEAGAASGELDPSAVTPADADADLVSQ